MSEPPSSALLPPVGETASFRFIANSTFPNDNMKVKATLTLNRLSPGQLEVNVAMGGDVSRSLTLHVDRTGVLETPTGELTDPKNNSADPKRASAALWQHLNLAARVCLEPGSESSYPIQMDVPWASGPVTPTLQYNSTDSNTFLADAFATTSINPPFPPSRFWTVGVYPALLVGPVLNLIGRGGLGVAASLNVWPVSRGGALPTQVKLHLSGQLDNGRLKLLSADQEMTVHAGRSTRKYDEQWMFTRL